MSGEKKGEVFNALRCIYDGAFRRDIHPEPVEWCGRLSLIAACTPAIDTFSAHADALGTRWLYFRMNDRDAATKRLVSKLVMQREHLHERRRDAAELSTRIITEARERIVNIELPEGLDDAICDTANLVVYGRANVPRDYRREVDGIVTVEDPGRIVAQLRLLALGLIALNLEYNSVLRIVRRAALGSMPQARARVIDVLVTAEEPMTEYRIARAADLDIKVAQRALEDWSLVSFAESQTVTGEKGLPATAWSLTETGRSTANAGTD
jgi:hypothetical protein